MHIPNSLFTSLFYINGILDSSLDLRRHLTFQLYEDKNSYYDPLVKYILISGMVNLQGCGDRILSGEVGMPGPCSEGLVQGHDAGDLEEPALPG